MHPHTLILNRRRSKTRKFGMLHLKLWFRDVGIPFPSRDEATVSVGHVNDDGFWWCISDNFDLLDRIAARARAEGVYAWVSSNAKAVFVDRRNRDTAATGTAKE